MTSHSSTQNSNIILITGGSRSGKSTYAQTLAENISSNRYFIATCPVIDDEMKARIQKHRQDRAGKKWHTIEEPLLLEDAIESIPEDAVALIDCVTLWVNNLQYDASQKNMIFNEARMIKKCQAVMNACTSKKATFIFVTNEVAMGIVPADETTRMYRDLVGRANQYIASIAKDVVLMVCGLPMTLKGRK